MEKDNVHIAEHEDGLDGDGGEEVDSRLVEEKIVADAWDQGQMATTVVVESLKSNVTYLLQNILRKLAETIVNSIVQLVYVRFFLTSQEKGFVQVCETKGREMKSRRQYGSS